MSSFILMQVDYCLPIERYSRNTVCPQVSMYLLHLERPFQSLVRVLWEAFQFVCMCRIRNNDLLSVPHLDMELGWKTELEDGHGRIADRHGKVVYTGLLNKKTMLYDVN